MNIICYDWGMGNPVLIFIVWLGKSILVIWLPHTHTVQEPKTFKYCAYVMYVCAEPSEKSTHCMIHAFSLLLAIHIDFFIWSVFILHLFFLLPLPFSFPRHTENVLSDLTENFFNESKIHIKFCGNKNETTAILFLLFFFSFQREEHLLQIICITLENSSSKTSNKIETDGANGSG